MGNLRSEAGFKLFDGHRTLFLKNELSVLILYVYVNLLNSLVIRKKVLKKAITCNQVAFSSVDNGLLKNT